MAPSGGSSSSKGKAKARPTSPHHTLGLIICSRPDLLARLETAKAETTRDLQSGSSKSSQGRKRARTESTKSGRDEKGCQEDKANFEPDKDDEDSGSIQLDGASEVQDPHSAGKVAKQRVGVMGRPFKEEVDIGAVVILPHGMMDLQKRIKKPSYNDVTALIHQCLAIWACHGELTVNKAWMNSKGLSWIATLFPDLTSLLFCHHPSEDNFGLVPLAANGQEDYLLCSSSSRLPTETGAEHPRNEQIVPDPSDGNPMEEDDSDSEDGDIQELDPLEQLIAHSILRNIRHAPVKAQRCQCAFNTDQVLAFGELLAELLVSALQPVDTDSWATTEPIPLGKRKELRIDLAGDMWKFRVWKWTLAVELLTQATN
ncbi:hypothetical protein M407DRAFT_11380 [Tulasnella calospora MUT 4182]|uniref:Uncharacterized protein n=1 Tax=Tulasnella calospora MUT 4182 TaxID=1051891 RepID=A0A0C3LDC9_9AGAM|nr:hypothetical protein M407DRAFT_11380 [Tulasnella calospora MUT 4182]